MVRNAQKGDKGELFIQLGRRAERSLFRDKIDSDYNDFVAHKWRKKLLAVSGGNSNSG